jgi:hypothetical protein
LGDGFSWCSLGGLDGVVMRCNTRSWKKPATAERHARRWYATHFPGCEVKIAERERTKAGQATQWTGHHHGTEAGVMLAGKAER